MVDQRNYEGKPVELGRARYFSGVIAGALCAIILAVSASVAGDLPNSEITPGLVEPGLTKDILCAPKFSPKTLRSVPSARKKAIYRSMA
jgi:hypothetical protein